MIKSLNEMFNMSDIHLEFSHKQSHNEENNKRLGDSYNMLFSRNDNYLWCNEFVEKGVDAYQHKFQWTEHELDDVYGMILNHFLNKSRREQLGIKTGLIIEPTLMEHYERFLKEKEYQTLKTPVCKIYKQNYDWNKPGNAFVSEEIIFESESFEETLEHAKQYHDDSYIVTWDWKNELLNEHHLGDAPMMF
jgi:hypothetical protein